MKKVAFYTLGCKTNQYETRAMGEIFTNAGYEIVDFSGYADVYVINTCTVTNLGDRKSRQIIRKAKKFNKNAIVVVTGCYAQTAPEEVLNIEGVNLIIGTKDRLKIVDYLNEIGKRDKPINAVTDIMNITSFEEMEVTKYSDKTRAFIKIQDGCTQFCSYCIIPYARGPIRSRSVESILNEIVNLVKSGYKEVVLTGIHIASYGKDFDLNNEGRRPELMFLVEEISQIEGIERIRIGSIEPTIITQEFIKRALLLPKLCPHYHISLQSGCDETLVRMNRKYTTEEYKTGIKLLRDSFDDVSITTDIMVGFPGETDDEFKASLNFVDSIGFMSAHVFKYSPRRGTKAASYTEQIASDVKEVRSKRMIEVVEKNEKKFYEKFIGREIDVLFERRIDENKDMFEGLAANYIRVLVKGEHDIEGKIIRVKLKGVNNGCIDAEIA